MLDMLQERSEYLEKIRSQIGCSRSRLNNLMTKIDWTYRSLNTKEWEEPDPPEHENTSNNLETAEGNKQEYQDTDLPILPQPSTSQLHPGSDKLYTELVESIAIQSKQNNEKKNKTDSIVQLFAMERDAKRRRISYKNKVHTKNKSHTEVLREVVEQQMQILQSDISLSSNDQKNKSEKEENDTQLVELPCWIGKGNPHLVWMNIGDYFQQRKSENSNSLGDTEFKIDKSKYPTFDKYSKYHSTNYRESKRANEIGYTKSHHSNNDSHRKHDSSRGYYKKYNEGSSKSYYDRSSRESDICNFEKESTSNYKNLPKNKNEKYGSKYYNDRSSSESERYRDKGGSSKRKSYTNIKDEDCDSKGYRARSNSETDNWKDNRSKTKNFVRNKEKEYYTNNKSSKQKNHNRNKEYYSKYYKDRSNCETVNYDDKEERLKNKNYSKNDDDDDTNTSSNEDDNDSSKYRSHTKTKYSIKSEETDDDGSVISTDDSHHFHSDRRSKHKKDVSHSPKRKKHKTSTSYSHEKKKKRKHKQSYD